MTELRLEGGDGKYLKPVFFSDNFFALLPGADFTFDPNLRTSSGAIRASFYVPIICFVTMFIYAFVFGKLFPAKAKEPKQ